MNNEISNSTSADVFTVLFEVPEEAEDAYQTLLEMNYDKKDITLMMSEETHEKYFLNENVSENDFGSKALEGMGIGGAVGGTVGAIAASIAAIGTTLLIPGLGIAIAGPLAASFAGAGAGATAGGLIGVLIGAGIPEEKAKELEAGIKGGGIIISVKTKSPEDYQSLENKWKRS